MADLSPKVPSDRIQSVPVAPGVLWSWAPSQANKASPKNNIVDGIGDLGIRTPAPNVRPGPTNREPSVPPAPKKVLKPLPPTKDRQKQLWLDSEATWKNRVGKGWVAKRVLGRGSFGIVGHWSYEGPDRAQKTVVDVAVKQGSSTKGGGLTQEAEYLMLMNQTKSLHFPRMYRRLYVDQGQNTLQLFGKGYDTGEVHRIYLEFCPGGTLWELQNDRIHAASAAGKDSLKFPTEVEMWQIFYCLSLATLAMHHGSEDSTVPKWDKTIVHFDIKNENLLFGAPTVDTEHTGYEPLKVSDFGLSEDVANWGDPQESRYWNGWARCGTSGFLTPEQTWQKRRWNSKVVSDGYSSWSNVWQMGLVMWLLQHGEIYFEEPDWEREMVVYPSTKVREQFIDGTIPYYTVGLREDRDYEIADGQDHDHPMFDYSQELQTLIKRCLCLNSAHRPSPAALERRARQGYQNTKNVLKNMPGASNITPRQAPYPDPTLSARWHSGQAPLQAPQPIVPSTIAPPQIPARPARRNVDDGQRNIPLLTVAVQEVGAANARDITFQNISASTTIAYLKIMLITRGCTIRPENMRISGQIAMFTDMQTLKNLPSFGKLTCTDATAGRR